MSEVNSTQYHDNIKPDRLISFFMSFQSPEKSSLFGSSYGKSPYYPGKTTFGGAGAHRRTRLPASSPYQVCMIRILKSISMTNFPFIHNIEMNRNLYA